MGITGGRAFLAEETPSAKAPRLDSVRVVRRPAGLVSRSQRGADWEEARVEKRGLTCRALHTIGRSRAFFWHRRSWPEESRVWSRF